MNLKRFASMTSTLLTERLGWTLFHALGQFALIAHVLCHNRRNTGGGVFALGSFFILILSSGLYMSAVADEPHAHDATDDTIGEIANQIAASMPLRDWHVESFDVQPSVEVDDYRGHRILLRRSWKEFTDEPQQQVAEPNADDSDRPSEIRHEDQEFVLFPVDPQHNTPPSELKSRIPWHDSHRQFPMQDICLGKGLGYVWFARSPVMDQDAVREKLKLTGGDDRIELLVNATRCKKGAEAPESYSAQRMLAGVGDRAIPVIEGTIERSQEDDDLWGVIGCLAFIKTDQSTELLQRLFRKEDKDQQRAAAYALIHKPFRESAKETYLAMLNSRYSVEYVCEACVKFDWTEAVSRLQELVSQPSVLRELSYTIRARRTLEGNPIDDGLLEAATGLRSDPNNQQAKQRLIASNDTEAANLLAIELATFSLKGNSQPVNDAGLAILKARPRASTVETLQNIVGGLPTDERRAAQKLLDVLEGRSLAAPPKSTTPFEDEDSRLTPSAPFEKTVPPQGDSQGSDFEALGRAMQLDPSFSSNPDQSNSQQQAIAVWQSFLRRDDLTNGQQVFAWWRIGSLAAYNFDPNRGELADVGLAERALEKVHLVAGELVCLETLNAATVYGGLPGEPNERAGRLAKAYRWLFTRTDQMVDRSAPQINHNGRCLSDAASPGGMNLQGVPAKRQFLQSELARCRGVITQRITEEIRYSQHPAAIAYLLQSIRDIADQEQIEQWEVLEAEVEKPDLIRYAAMSSQDDDHLENELARQMQEFRHQLQTDKNSKDIVAKQIGDLLQRHPNSTLIIHRLAAHTYGQSNIRFFSREVTHHAELALPLERDPVERSRLFMYLSNAAEVDGEKALSSDWYLKGWFELQPYDLPGVAPELPSVGNYRGLLNPASPDDSDAAERAKTFEILQAAELKQRRQAEATRDLVRFRDIFVDGMRRLNNVAKDPAGLDQLRQRARELLADEGLAKALMDAVLNAKQ